ncbi:DUF202 domain-containing protein [Terracoccus sp. 273MFTsu3.1]|uniref:DUF202 domain-containing protein n=1 Tax=Terracoccus sp. 273MFTsu3.1 TaxID=1172188 RepID=UPI000377C9B8|nr:DUF202 domain-containing protein [Terracoccus sp. 273MFTsu3.1]
MTSPADPGLQAERTSLAWRRTALSVAVGSLVAMRVLPPQLGPLGYAVALLGLLWSVDIALTARRRYRDGSRLVRLRDDPDGRAVAAVPIARTAAIAGVLAIGALALVIVIASR